MKSDEEYVQEFAEGMTAKLEENKGKGLLCNLSGTENIGYLLTRLREETHELTQALGHPCPTCYKGASDHRKVNLEAVVKECADVANFAMMIAIVTRERLK